MHALLHFSVVALAVLLHQSFVWPMRLHGSTTHDHIFARVPSVLRSTDDVELKLEIHTNLTDPSKKYNAYILGNPEQTSKIVQVLQQDGTGYKYVQPANTGSDVPVPITEGFAIPLTTDTTLITLPGWLWNARIWLSENELVFKFTNGGLVQPAPATEVDDNYNVSYGFIELNFYPAGDTNEPTVFVNLSFVDFVGLVLGMAMTYQNGSTEAVPGLYRNALTTVCDGLKSQAQKDNRSWDKMCLQDGDKYIRAISPNMYSSQPPNRDMDDYYTKYIDDVWNAFKTQPLLMDTQDANHTKVPSGPQVSCKVTGEVLDCGADAGQYVKPTTLDVWGCNTGPFVVPPGANEKQKEIIPRLCAAFFRSTLLLDGGSVQPSLPSAKYYTADPTNHYGRLVHEGLQDGRGYAFSYDDVNAGTENVAGVLKASNIQKLSVTLSN
ncbi:Uu.00g064220.m01.CDS01 [Anthostomella pinea]|uniref:Uu.00g064220.m01.CDS01 n=1 Tax=Anthostomella pinea TaxID=933095 RepID=A0AAI8VTH8_9PEZI|nr:Uu.00g064220.m01.CDS01 [Anthostomella pinea]